MFQKVILLILLSIASIFAWGQRGLKPEVESKPLVGGQTYAIVIGISKYKAVPSLQYAHRDAEAFKSLLMSPAGGKVPPENIEFFMNEEATRNNVADAISETARKAKPGDRVYFFFAGHGDMEDLTQIENGLLLLYNSPNGNYFGMKDDVLELLDLKRYLSPLAQRDIEMIFIVDACHSGNLKGGVEGLQMTTQALATAWGKEYKILSCQPNQLSQEGSQWGGGRGLFALQLEEGIKGLADRNGDYSVSFAEVQQYILEKVSTFSEYKQIPLVVGDLSKPLVRVDTATLNQLRKQKENERLTLGQVNTKGNENQWADSLSDYGKKLYASFQRLVVAQQLIWPRDTNAMRDYRAFTATFPNHPLATTMRRNLAAALNQRFDSIVNPMLRGETSYSTKDGCYYAGMELDSCMSLLGESHYMYRNLQARSLFMKAMTLTWALTEGEYNIGMQSTVKKSVAYLEESERLEPNTAYTIGQLGEHYFLLGEYAKANEKFERYLSLRPSDYWAKQTLANIYSNQNLFGKAEILYRDLLKKYPAYAAVYHSLSNTLYEQGKKNEARDIIQPLLTKGYDTTNYYFLMGLWSTKANLTDSSMYWYRKCYAFNPAMESICLNNIGHKLMVKGAYDSAVMYFKRVIEIDSATPFPYFNLGCISMLQQDYAQAAQWHVTGLDKNNTNPDGYLSGMSLYYGKKYKDIGSKAFHLFDGKMRTFKLVYLSYLNILYVYLRVPSMFTQKEDIELIFQQLDRFKQYDATTEYHRACYGSLRGDTEEAMKRLESALAKGFGDSFALRNDLDLAAIQKLPSFGKLMKQYFK
ncbi:MAG: caspase family protein [Bacteroidota bacterium]